MNVTRYKTLAWITTGYNLLVILWGAYVRATGSGAGCGRHWPLCNGEVIPRPEHIETLVEYAHRVSSGLALLLVIALVWYAWKLYPAGHPVRKAAGVSGAFILSESLLGAALVLFAWVAHDQSVYRAVAMGAHLLNTLLLIASLALTAWYASGQPAPSSWKRAWQDPLQGLSLAGLVLIGISGAITALGDTLFPEADFAANFSPSAHFLIRLRIWHPVLAVLAGYLILRLVWKARPAAPELAQLVIGLILVQWLAGLVNVWLRAPVWMQLLHLLLADSLWILYILFLNQKLVKEAA